MSLEPKIFKLIADDQRYFRYISKKTKDESAYKVINIPEESFLSKSLQELTFDELSQCLKVRFLGEIPLNWKISKKNVRKNILKLLHEISRNVYVVKALTNEGKYFYGEDFNIKDIKLQKTFDNKNMFDADLGSLIDGLDVKKNNKIQKLSTTKSKNVSSRRNVHYTRKRHQYINTTHKQKNPNKIFNFNKKNNILKSNTKTIMVNESSYQNLFPRSIRKNLNDTVIAGDTLHESTDDEVECMNFPLVEGYRTEENTNIISVQPKSCRQKEKTQGLGKVQRPRYFHTPNPSNIKYFQGKYKNGFEMILDERMLVLIAPRKERKIQRSRQSNVPLLSCLKAWTWNEINIQVYASEYNGDLFIHFKSNNKAKFVYLFLPKYRRYTKEIFTFQIDENCRVLPQNIQENTLCLERNLLGSTEGKGKSNLLHYFIRTNSNSSLEKLFSILSSRHPIPIREQLPEISLSDQKLSICLPRNKKICNSFDYLTSHRVLVKKILQTDLGYKEWSSPLRRFINVSLMEMMQPHAQNFNPLKYEEEMYILRGNVIRKLTESELNQFWSSTYHTKSSSKYILKKRDSHLEKANLNPLKIEKLYMNSIEGFTQEVKKVVRLKSNPSYKLGTKMCYFFLLKNLLFIVPSSCAILPFLTEIQQNVKMTNKKDKDSTPHIIDPLIFNKYHHIPWLKNDLKLKEFHKNDYRYFQHFCRKISLVLYSTHCIDLTTVSNIHLDSPRDGITSYISLNNLKKKQKKLSTCKKTSTYISSSVVVLQRGRSNVKFLFSSDQVANEWMTQLNQIKNYWKNHDSKNKNLTAKNNIIVNSTPHTNSFAKNGSPYTGSTGLVLTNNSIMSILIHHGILYIKSGKYNIFKKYLVVLIPGTLILYKINKRSFSGNNETNLKYPVYKVVVLEYCYVYPGNSDFRALFSTKVLNNSTKTNSDHISKLYGDGWRSNEDQFIRSFTLQFGSRKKRITTQIEKVEPAITVQPVKVHSEERFQQSKTNSKLKKLEGLHFLSNKTVHYFQQNQIFLARSQQERDLWVALISKEIERLQ
ncbi:similar to Saccharomyces cerevisiae YDR104C SPO71 Meiosis-specific protein of unknown function, required for spore wall formation during sporulation [Maudiozyma saulgeensis]|uniref:PH domain-containing protein n=1 Tax=Maudiozyma saulgeensis TaxID=1789683 RepID=A0A1X7R604_9SACH|nr:similar to Saccharomyces cerevisiae YDR104C SPO71 Meiosis-specific protein of unknown function, required for spore wall formation during sporulation [Kazachstania saulgeensis]